MRNRNALIAITLAALALRFGWALLPVERGQDDEAGYHRLAVSIVERGEYSVEPGKPTAQYPPGWPALIAASYSFFGSDIKVARCLTAALGALLVLLVFALTKSLFGEGAALCAAGIASVHPLLVYWSGVAMTETPFAAAIMLGILLLIENRRGAAWYLAAGAVWGAAALIRATAMPVLVFCIFAWLAVNCRSAVTLRWREGAARIFLLIAAFAVVLSPWAYRNYKVLGTFGLDFHGGYSVLLGNMFYEERLVDTTVAAKAAEQQPWYAAAQKLPEPQQDRFYMEKAKEFVKTHKRLSLKHWIKNVGLLWRLYPRQEHSMPHSKKLLLWVSLAAELPVFVLFFAGLWLERAKWRGWLLLVAPFIALTAVHAVSVAQMRYRLPLTPFMVVFAGAALCRLIVRFFPRFANQRCTYSSPA